MVPFIPQFQKNRFWLIFLLMPVYDAKCEALIPVLEHKIPLKAHAHQANDIFNAIRVAKEFGLDITLEHVTEGHLIVDELVKENLPLAVGPSFGHASKFEMHNKCWETAGILANAGCHVSIITDAPVIPLHYLPLNPPKPPFIHFVASLFL